MNSLEREAEPTNSIVAQPADKESTTKPEGFVSLSLDVVDLISELLDPKTLVSFARVSSAFRAQLFSEIHWTRCRERAGLPTLNAKDITDRQYIHLLFDTHCHDCGMANIRKLDLLACARLCLKCRDAYQSRYRDDVLEYHPQARICAKSYRHQYWLLKGGQTLRRPRGIAKLSQKLYSLDGQELEDFIHARSVLKEHIAQDSRTIEKWLEQQEFIFREETLGVLSDRAEAIRTRLLALGWTSDTYRLLPLAPWTKSSIAEPLTERDWNWINSQLWEDHRQFLQMWGVNARKSDVVKAYDSFFERDQDKPLFPSLMTFLSFETVQDVLNTSSTKFESKHELEPSEPDSMVLWDTAHSKIAPFIQEYQSRVTEHAISLLKKAYIAASLPCPPDSSILTDSRSLFHVSVNSGAFVTNQIRRFPLIHEVMRDRQDIEKWRGTGRTRAPLASEFLNGDDRLKVDLEARNRILVKGSGWVINEE